MILPRHSQSHVQQSTHFIQPVSEALISKFCSNWGYYITSLCLCLLCINKMVKVLVTFVT